ncbi:sulfatase-like hydrolase/transferase [Neorhodopirellula pilleata]|uniref:Arylsulfatase n=1 Tax=Neorhodopirellula pilleata TaxID=2714738 RepID=A0A5C6AT90_9BACT|nr:sulfatase-like hydrolase/transferase [Neorhodopirellula pilleata]TWU03273.1 Arylsulfatase [Neorhodopirellula pilleata]
MIKYVTPLLMLVAFAFAGRGGADDVARPAKTNVVYIMADELGYFEPSYMGNPNIQTPNLDRMAAEGIRFTQGMAGSSVCAPTRCCFLTGKHSGHTSVRSNGGGTPLRADEETVASILKPLGYATGGFGKWGNGGRGSTGVPEKHGFDVFVGYYDQVHAHSYYPPYILRNSEEMPLAGNHGNSDGETYSHYVIMNEAMKFIRENKDKPFFAYLPVTPPHGIFDIPDEDPAWAIYRDKPWDEPAKRYAAMVTMLDRQVGEVLALLDELGLEDNTLVLFSGDNGGADYFSSKDHPRGVHGANKHPETGAEFRGKKGQLYEGGLRIPFLARWPGKIQPGRTSDLLFYFPDLLPTIAEVTGAKAPADVDGISILPELIGEEAAGHPQAQHEYLYWEINGQTAVRMGNWKAIQPRANAAWELYDLATDISESNDLATTHPEVLAKLQAYATQAHIPVMEGTFDSTDLHERDRAAKFGGKSPAPKKNKRGVKKAVGMPTKGMLDNKDWKIVRASSENVANQKYARNAIDGDESTLWHTRFGANAAEPPHELVIDLGATRRIEGFVYLGRQDGGWNGAVKDVEFYVSEDPDKFGTPLVSITLAKTKEPQRIECEMKQARYLLMRTTTEYSGGEFATVAELGVIGD